uniref:Zinc finger C2H2 LYAR-type domain-containing protein n=1 Tax=Spumella elongata TaxID=89044 RepID=A0A7S3HA97_9STRA|mmetsp:Transcript_42369/g.73669  ORF Transcript_42369/g.73669 Transcript_42369/m.73669 type:complete len:228 (+) Transcript_42369:30-713(+)
MVFFVCEGCNETVKKNQVDKHASRCRSCHAVTCVDCSVTFYGNDYAEHITCVSEAEKYEKTLYKAKAVKLNPQYAWNAQIETATSKAETAPAIVRPYLQRLGELNNVPRNKKKFINFAKNSLRLYSDNVLEALWNYLDTYRVLPATKEAPQKAEPVVEAVVEPIVESEAADEETEKDKKKKAKKDKRKREAEEASAAAEVEVAASEEKEEKSEKKQKKSKKSKKESE